MFRNWFSKKSVALTGARPVRRVKTYSAHSGYVYQYYYEGCRPLPTGAENCTEFVFSISPDRKNWHFTSVLVCDTAIAAWESAHGRALSANERYAAAKMGLFQAFDERPEPAQMKAEVRLRACDIEAIMETLDL